MRRRVTEDSPPKKDLTGLRSGKLVVESFAGRRQFGKDKRWYCYWNCRCDCGNAATVVAHSLGKRKCTRSCGCLPAGSPANPHRRDHPYEYVKWIYLIKVHGDDVCDRWKDFDLFFADMGECPHSFRLKRKTGRLYEPSNCLWGIGINLASRERIQVPPALVPHHHREYEIWLYLIKVHGDDVCDRWKDFDLFFADMGECPHRSRIRRKEGNPYDPENCFWLTPTHRGGRYSKLLTFDGKTLSRTAWSKRTGIQSTVISGRLAKGWSVEDTLTIPSGKRSSLAIKLNSSGVEHLRIARAGGASIKKLATRFHLSPSSVRRISSGELFAYMEGPICRQDAKAGGENRHRA